MIHVHRGGTLKPTIAKAVLTDVHFWLPVIVLVLGIATLMAVK
jgi:hypothetical protein